MLSPERIEELCHSSRSKLDQLRALLRARRSALVAFSGGVDSAFVLKVALEELGERAVALTAISPSVAPVEQREARELARALGARHLEIESHEMDDPRYVRNPTDRCYFCKSELYAICERARAELGLAVVVDGFNADDRSDHRPGHRAAREKAVLSPLAEAGLTKDEIRAWSNRLGLPTWDKAAMPCLASRLPYGTPVTPERLSQVAAAESALVRLGFRQLRVRHHGDVARVEIGAAELPRIVDPQVRAEATRALKAIGFRFVVLDLEPFRSGRLNEAAGIVPRPSD
jgi:uncharacterized protein